MERLSSMSKTTTKSSAAKKTTEAAKTRAEAVAAAEAPELKVVQETKPEVSAPELKKKELIDLVVARTGVKKKDAKPVVEAVMTVLGEAIGEGRELNLQPLGKIKVNKIKSMTNGKVMITRIRQSEASVGELEEGTGSADKEALAEADE